MPEKQSRTNDPERTMADILRVATAEFADKGLSGARIDEIAALTRTSKRMIYYYFGNKEGLYLAVLEDVYRRIRVVESQLQLEDLPPAEALRKLVAFTFDYQHEHEEFIRLVMNENMQRGEFLAQSRVIQELNTPVIDAVRQIYERGVAEGVFRPHIDPVDIHLAISSLCFFSVANRHTFGLIFKSQMGSAPDLAKRRDNACEMLLRFVQA